MAAAPTLRAFGDVPPGSLPEGREYTVFPGFCDVHVHFREPGFSYKEDMKSGSLAAAHGGYTDVCTMPNLSPVPDDLPHLLEQQRCIDARALVRVHPYGAITRGEAGKSLSHMAELAGRVIGFSDDGRGVQSSSLMRRAMEQAAGFGALIAAHCEVNELLKDGCIHDGAYAAARGIPGISSESEWRMVRRDLLLAKETGCKYHVCHVSCRESVELIRRAKAEGVDVSCETAPHYLLLDESCLKDEGRFKMNPPLRGREDREALLEGLLDGTIDMVATDHAPHSPEEKAKGLRGSAFGVTGLETAFPALYTRLVIPGILALDRLVDLLAHAPRRRFGIPLDQGDYSVWDLSEVVHVTPDFFLSKGTATPFAGEALYGKCLLTRVGGKTIYGEERST